MSWEDQGRQEHGWFGHGQHSLITSAASADIPDRAELRARNFATFEFAMDRLGGEPGIDTIRHGGMRDAFRTLVPQWAQCAAAPANTFRQRCFGADADPVEAWGMQRAVLAVRAADTHAGLKHAGVELADAMRTIGLPNVRAFVEAAERQAASNELDDSPRVQLVADESSREEEEKEARQLLPKIPIRVGHAPDPGDSPDSRGLMPRIGGAAALAGDRSSLRAASQNASTRGQKAERYYGASLGDDHPSQLSFLGGKEVKYGTPGSVRPDYVTPDRKTASFEVKSYDLAKTPASNLVNDIARQAAERAKNLPEGMKQTVAIDITGQTVTVEQRAAIRSGIVVKSGGVILRDDIEFFEQE